MQSLELARKLTVTEVSAEIKNNLENRILASSWRLSSISPLKLPAQHVEGSAPAARPPELIMRLVFESP
jgi:hypothetical protein